MLHCRLHRSVIMLALVVVTCQSINPGREYVTSLPNRLELLTQNRQLVLNLMDYVDQLQERIDLINRVTKYFRTTLQTSKGQENEFLSNPLNSFSLLRQMQSDWSHVLGLMEQRVGQVQIDFLREMHKKRPKLEDVRDSMTAIHRIKEAYKLKSSDMAKGLLEGVQYNAKLSALDCYEMGQMYYNGSKYEKAEEWLVTAIQLMDDSQSDLYSMLGVTRSDISSLLARSLIVMGNMQHARAVLMSEPNLSPAVEEWLDYFKANIPEKVENAALIESKESDPRLCSSNYITKPSRLLCSFKTTPIPFLRLAPFKMEVLSMDPYVVVFHDVVYSSEIAELDRATESMLERAETVGENKEIVISNQRIVSAAWLPSPSLSWYDNNLVQRIRQRVKDLSGLILDCYLNSNIQMLKYGFGGHYAVHSDFMFDNSFNDRLATVLLYLNDVTSGGATIFPKLNLTVKPEQGKVLHWYNIMPDSFDYDPRTRHGACPVIIGRKLALTQWIHEEDQMFVKPCLKPPKVRKFI